MEKKESRIQTETRLLYTIWRLTENLIVDVAIGMAQHNYKLCWRAGALARMAIEERSYWIPGS